MPRIIHEINPISHTQTPQMDFTTFKNILITERDKRFFKKYDIFSQLEIIVDAILTGDHQKLITLREWTKLLNNKVIEAITNKQDGKILSISDLFEDIDKDLYGHK